MADAQEKKKDPMSLGLIILVLVALLGGQYMVWSAVDSGVERILSRLETGAQENASHQRALRDMVKMVLDHERREEERGAAAPPAEPAPAAPAPAPTKAPAED